MHFLTVDFVVMRFQYIVPLLLYLARRDFGVRQFVRERRDDRYRTTSQRLPLYR